MLKKYVKKIIDKILVKFKPKTISRFPPNVKIGKNTSIAENVFMFRTAPITIGEHTMIAYNVTIHTSTHDYHNHPMWIERIDRPVEIGQHVWIGTGAILLSGVKIGDYAVIGAGAIVNKNVPRGAIVVGNPARIINFRDLNKILKDTRVIPDYPNESYITKKSFVEKNLNNIE